MNRALVSALFISIAALLVGGCGGSDDESGSADSSTTSPVSDGDSDGADDETTTPVDGDSGDSDSGGGESSGTLTLADDTVYDFEMSTCDTSDSKPDKFLVDPGFDIFGASEDGWKLSLTRAGLDEDSANPVGVLDIDDVTYGAVGAEDMSLDVDGSAVTGTVRMSSLDPGAPMGTDVEFTVDISC